MGDIKQACTCSVLNSSAKFKHSQAALNTLFYLCFFLFHVLRVKTFTSQNARGKDFILL